MKSYFKNTLPKTLTFLLIILAGLAITRKFDTNLISGDLQDMFIRERYVKSYTQQDLYSNLKDFSVNNGVIIPISNNPWILFDTTGIKAFKYIRLDIDLHGAKTIPAQFFYVTNERDFNETDSKRQVLKQGINHIRILPIQEYKALRLDLTLKEGISLSVRSVELTNKFTPPVKHLVLITLLNILWCGIWSFLLFKFVYMETLFYTMFNWLNGEVGTSHSPNEGYKIARELLSLHLVPNMIHITIYDVESIKFSDCIILECGKTDPQLYFSLSHHLEKPNGIVLCEIVYTSTIAGILQVYWDYGEGLSEENSTKEACLSVTEAKSIRLPIINWIDNTKLVALRIDPPVGAGFTIKSVVILSIK